MNLINSSRPQTFFSKLSHTIKKHKFQYANKLYIQPQRLFSSYQRSQSYNQDQKKSYQPLDFDPKIDYYQRLGIQLNASEDEIKKAFYKLAKQYHPDSHLNQSTPQDEHKFKEISAAYDVLSDKEKKTLYDQLREELGREQFKSYSNNRKASEWTYTYNQNWERKQKTAYDNFYQYAHEQQKNQRQRYEGWNYSSAKEEYQSGFKEDSNRKQREQAYKEYYDNFNEEQYKKYEEKMRRDQERAKSQQESKPKSDETNIRNLFLSFLGFSLGTYLIFGGSSSTATEPKYVPSGQVYGSQNSHKPILQKWTNSNFPDSNYYQPSTFKGKIQKKKFDSSTSLDEAYNYYSQFQGDVAIPKMEVKNSSTPIKDVLEKEKEERRILNQKKREAKQKQIQEQKKQNQKVGNKKSDRQEKDFKYKEPEPVQLTNKIKENHLYLRTHDQVLASKRNNTY